MRSIFAGINRSRTRDHEAGRVEHLEPRRLLAMADPASIKIPVFNFHRVLDTIPASDLDKNGDSPNILTANFRTMINDLESDHFFSVKLQNYLNWRKNPSAGLLVEGLHGEHVLQSGEYGFIATFDDGNYTDRHTVADILKTPTRFFTGVAAIATQLVGTPLDATDTTAPPERRYISWADVRDLAYGGYDWDIVSHTRFHKHQARTSGTKNKASDYLNTPSQVHDEIFLSMRDIEKNVFRDDNHNGVEDPSEPFVTPLAFIHPFHDVTYRTLRLAREAGYPMIFGKTGSSFIGLGQANESDLQSGQLLRLAISYKTTISAFDKILTDAMATTPFALPNVPKYPKAYIATDGTIVADGNDTSETFKVDNSYVTVGKDKKLASTAFVNATTAALQLAPGGYSYSNTGVSNPHGVKRFDVNAGGGNNVITLNMVIPSTMVGGSGADSFTGGGGADSMRGGGGKDALTGNGGNDILRGGSGNDILIGGAGKDKLYGDAGDDTFYARDTLRDVLDGGAGSDKAQVDAQVDSLTSIETLLV